jgi:quercetin dioxygenase-like cupin family protein
MRSLALLFGIALIGLFSANVADTAPHGAGGLSVFTPADVKWANGPASLPHGAKMAVLEGDPTKEGPFVMRLWLPDGYRIPPHTHPKPERLTVISGSFHIGMGEKFDPKGAVAMPAGSFGTWAAGMKHFVWAEGDTVVQLHGIGPWSIEYVNPADDPRKQPKAVPEKTESGPQVGDQLPGLVYALVCVDAQLDLVGKKSELVVERYGPKPGALVFARDLNEQVASLIKRLDDELAKNKAVKAKVKEGHALVVLLSDDDALESKLKDFADKRDIKQVTVGIDRSPGPPKWKLSREAEVTIILYESFKVTRNYALKRGELTGETIDTIVAEVSAIFGR